MERDGRNDDVPVFFLLPEIWRVNKMLCKGDASHTDAPSHHFILSVPFRIHSIQWENSASVPGCVFDAVSKHRGQYKSDACITL